MDDPLWNMRYLTNLTIIPILQFLLHAIVHHKWMTPIALLIFLKTNFTLHYHVITNMLIDFVPTSCQLLASNEAEIDSFITATHNANSGRRNNVMIINTPYIKID